MVHRRVGSVFLDRLPGVASQVECKSYGGGCGWFPVQADSVEFVNRVAAAGEIYSLISFRCSRRNPIPRCAWMRGQFAPLDFLGIVAINLANPALIGRDEPGAVRVF